MKHTLLLLLTVLLFACENKKTIETPTEEKPVSEGNLTLPEGFYATIVADNLGRGQHLAVNKNGDVYVKLRQANEDGHTIIGLRDTDGDGKADEQVGFGNFTGTGIGIYNNYLYASSKTAIYRFALGENLLPNDTVPELVISGFLEQNEHDNKGFTFDNDGNIYVGIGSPTNCCQEQNRAAGSMGIDPCPDLKWQAGIWKFDANKANQTLKNNGTNYATGIRNCIGLDWNDASNGLFAMQHGRDQLSQFWGDLYDDKENAELPSEEFFQISEGDDFGWPYCYFDHLKDKKILNPEYGGDGETQGRCENVKRPIKGFPGHLAPNDLLFYTGEMFPTKYRNGAFIAFHGSWNRSPEPQQGYYVVFVPMNEKGEITGESEIFATGFAGAENIASPSDAEHRPTGLAQGADGALYVSDSKTGRIYRIAYQ